MLATKSSTAFGIGLMLLMPTPLRAQQNAATPAPPRLNAGDIDTMPARAGIRIAYGTDTQQFGELRVPSGRGPFPLAIIVHGGCYLSSYAGVRNTAPLADALARVGVATWNIEYRRYDQPGGGWPGTFTDVAMAADFVRTIAREYSLDLNRIVVAGHSAGGQLALWLAARQQMPVESALYMTAPLAVRGVVALGPIADMRKFYLREKSTCGNPAVEAVLGGKPDSVPERLRVTSPIEFGPLHVPIVLIAGDADFIAPRYTLDAYAKVARTQGDWVTIVTTAGEGHFESIAPTRAAGTAAIAAIARLAGLKTTARPK